MFTKYNRLSPWAVGGALAVLVAVASGPVRAEPAPAYNELLGRLAETPSLAESSALVEAAEARVRQARVRSNPTLSFSGETSSVARPLTGFKEGDLNLAVSQPLELWGRRSARVNLARAEAGTAALQRDLALIDSAGRLALTYAEAEATQRRAKLAEEGLGLALADARAALALVEEGREPLLRGIQAESEAAAARATLDEAKAEEAAAFARLAAVAMLSTPPTSITSSLLDAGSSQVALSTEGVPTVRVAEAQLTAAQRRVDTALVEGRPDLTANIELTRNAVQDDVSMTVGFSVPLPLFDRNRGNIDAARAEYRAAQARVLQARQDAGADRAAAVARLSASTSRVSAADAGVASTDQAYRLSRIGAEAGRISQLELRVSRAALINARGAAVDARVARVRAEIDLARLDGRAPFQGNP